MFLFLNAKTNNNELCSIRLVSFFMLFVGIVYIRVVNSTLIANTIEQLYFYFLYEHNNT